MALRMSDADFLALASTELDAWRSDPTWCARARLAAVDIDDSPAATPMAEMDLNTVILHKKPILSLVDTKDAAREIVRHLIRWGLERI